MIQGFWTLLKWWLKILDYSECTSWWFCQPNSWIDYDGLRLTMSDFILNFTSPCCVLFIVEFCELPHKMGPPRYVKVGLLPVTSSWNIYHFVRHWNKATVHAIDWGAHPACLSWNMWPNMAHSEEITCFQVGRNWACLTRSWKRLIIPNAPNFSG